MNQSLPWQEFAAPSPAAGSRDGKFVDSILIRKLRNFGPLSDKEKQILSNLIVDTQDVPAREDIVREGDRPTHSCVLLEGFACRYKMTADGQRQILAFQFPGDISDLYSFVLKVMDHSIGALTDCQNRHHSACQAAGHHRQPSASDAAAVARHARRQLEVPRMDGRHRPALGAAPASRTCCARC